MSGERHGPAWHVGGELAARYADGLLAETDDWSVEKHLESCGACATRVSRAVRAGAAGAELAEIRAAVLGDIRAASPAGDEEAASPAAHSLPTGPRRPRRGRLLWAAGPALRGPWALALLLVAAGAVGLGKAGGYEGARPLLLALAPVLPVAGIALSYGRHADPAYELAATSPSGGLRLLLTRAAAVLAVCVPLLTVAGLLLPGTMSAGHGGPVPYGTRVPGAAAWLLPGLALTLASLALTAFLGCRTATLLVGGGWLLALAVPTAARGDSPGRLIQRLTEQISLYFDGAAAQAGWAAAIALSGAVLAVCRSAYDHLEKA
ncbi:zf-HC2 domain-containing protein [Streptomyces sp. NBC_00056]|uniref:zf-HC2 domain-containing protein n=1 Tax=unclassified Streptomyces TaxID=2593676 RepID=UPI0022545182|nr:MULTISPECIES: zf-HC2 domain-containing protein [unclassified Streptomyces]MCX5437374.1 zf-HC2 domain-containing protein [Streptomyces sp. NBC_00063]WSE15068.1 zf-HC2 domain-containing protein [Streptomyces sp. NBC_01397]